MKHTFQKPDSPPVSSIAAAEAVVEEGHEIEKAIKPKIFNFSTSYGENHHFLPSPVPSHEVIDLISVDDGDHANGPEIVTCQHPCAMNSSLVSIAYGMQRKG